MIIDITYVNSSNTGTRIHHASFTTPVDRTPSSAFLHLHRNTHRHRHRIDRLRRYESKGPRGLCSLIVDNNFSSDIVIKLYEVRDPTQALHYMYVSGKSTAVVEGIAPGNLMMRYSMGREWDKTKKMFLHDRANFETDQVFKFEQSETEVSTSDGIRKEKHWSVQQLKLNANGVEGNVTTSQIDDDEFQDRK